MSRLLTTLLLLVGLSGGLALAEEPGERSAKLLTERDYDALERRLAEIHGKGRESNRWTTALETELEGILARTPGGRISYTNEWARKNPRSSWPFLIRAEFAMAEAWRRRRAREGNDHEWLNYARRDLDRARNLRPRLAVVQARLITIMAVQGDSRHAARRARIMAERLDPDDMSAPLAYATFMLPGWQGSRSEVIRYGREISGDRARPERDYVMLWIHSQLVEKDYLRSESRRIEVRRLVARLRSGFPLAWETHVSAARIYEVTESWKDYREALEAAAKLKHFASMRALAERLAQGGRGFQRDPSAALEWRERLARDGDAPSMVALADQLATGEGVSKNDDKARVWLDRAMRAGSGPAHTRMALRYAEGRGVPRDLGEAKRLLERARKLSDPDASLHLGRLHNQGAFGVRDAGQATRFLREAAQRGNVEALVYLARCYEEKSPRNAAHYYRRALEEGAADAAEAFRRLLRAHPELREEGDPEEVIDPTLRPKPAR